MNAQVLRSTRSCGPCEHVSDMFSIILVGQKITFYSERSVSSQVDHTFFLLLLTSCTFPDLNLYFISGV